MAALQTITQCKPGEVKQAKDSPKREFGNGLPKKLAAGIASQVEDIIPTRSNRVVYSITLRQAQGERYKI